MCTVHYLLSKALETHLSGVIQKDNGTASAVIRPPNTNPNPITNANPSPNNGMKGHTTGQLYIGVISAPTVSVVRPVIF